MTTKSESTDFQGPRRKAARANGSEVPPPPLEPDPVPAADHTALDEAEQLLAESILTDDDGDEPGETDEIKIPIVVKKLPQFANFRAKPLFELWAASSHEGMDETIHPTTKTFAPQFENDVDLRRCRFYETVTANDNVVRLVWAFVPDAGERNRNLWVASKIAALEHARDKWTTMRSRKKLQQYTFRASTKDFGEPRFSGLTKEEHLKNLKEQGFLVTDKDHPFYKRATDTE
jgi:hypothetical protein